MPAPLPRFPDRLQCEALRRYEEYSGELADGPADLQAALAGGDFEQRLVARARRLAPGIGLDTALTAVEHAAGYSVLAIVVVGLVMGASAAQAVLGTGGSEATNFYTVLVVMLGLHTLSLLLWLCLVLLPARYAQSSPSAKLGVFLLRVLHHGGTAAAARAAFGAWLAVHASPGLARASMSVLVHTAWLAILAGMLGATLALFSARQYDFIWETTILPDSAFVELTAVLGAGPRQLGIAVPDAALTGASRRGAGSPPDAGVARRAWSGLLIGSLLLYGLMPRAVLVLATRLWLGQARARFRLASDLPQYARLRPRLMPAATGERVVDPAPAGGPGHPAASERPGRIEVAPGTRVLGLELDPPAGGWPPPLARDVVDLGIVRDSAALTEALSGLAATPAPLLVVASLASSPDRGTRRSLQRIRAAARAGLLLTQSGRCAARLGADATRQRIADWLALAQVAGFEGEDVHLLDLDDIAALRAASPARVTP